MTKHYQTFYFISLLLIGILFYSLTLQLLTPYLPSEILMIYKGSCLLLFMGWFVFSIGLIYWVRTQLLSFTTRLMSLIQNLMNQEPTFEFSPNEDTLLSKIESQLQRLMELMQEREQGSKQEKEVIQTLIADLSHQIKTPLANVMMYNETMISRDLQPEQRQFCLTKMNEQLNKLEFLIQSLLKMSRFENGILQLHPASNSVHEMLSNALSGMTLKANMKQLKINLSCESDLMAYFDSKWTSEAVFNVLENAVKYTEQGSITIRVEPWELFTKIEIQDSGIGIKESDLHQIFKRFYRSLTVSQIEGVGVGLYLSREILMKQGGYIKVKSTPGVGSTFSLFIRNTP